MWPVTDPAKRKHVLALVNHAFRVSHPTPHVPVDNPVSLDRAGLARLSNENYIVAYKADGTRYLLALTVFNGRPLAVLVDRAGRIYSLHVQAQWSHFHRNSVFDGELCVIDGSCQHFMVFNALMDQGTSLLDMTYPQRLKYVQSNFPTHSLTPDERRNVTSFIIPMAPQLHFVCKEWDFARNMRAMLRNVMPRYNTDGFVLTPVDQPVISGRNAAMFKWKRDHPIDVRATIRGNQLLLEVDDNGTPVPLHRVMPQVVFDDNDADWVQLICGWQLYDSVVHNDSGTFYHVVEMSCTPVGDHQFKLQYMRLRPDKEGPNNVQTIHRTLQSIHDNITQEDLFDAVGL
jgi:hypothetical protein